MKKIVIAALFSVLVFANADVAGAAGGIGVDLSGNWASEPSSGFDDTFGLELGMNVDFRKFGVNIDSKNLELLGRVSLGYYDWDKTQSGFNLDYQRIPLFLGARLQTSLAPQVKFYGQLGLEFSFDDKEYVNAFGKQSDSELNVGLTPGIGLLFPITNSFYAAVRFDYHIISDDYATLGLTLGFNLP
ncbi:MAG TPA: outer membrane beta-barrel protein [Candidatus Deferrimicrobiaceae bacterium]